MEFTINKISAGWADIVFATNQAKLNMNISYGRDSFLYLTEAVLKTWNKEKEAGHIYFELESEGWMDLLIINYPSGSLKLEFYDSVLWDNYGEDDMLPPVPVFTALSTHHELANIICSEMKKYGEAGFKEWGHPYPAAIVDQLKRKMIKGQGYRTDFFSK